MREFIIAKSRHDYAVAAKLFSEYAQWLGIDLSFQHFEEELQEIEKMYAAPNGGIILCKEEEACIACVGVRKFAPGIAELKRMYVQPAHQHKGIGRELMQRSLQLAVSCGYEKILLDTLNDMTPAISLYKSYGFTETTAYYHNPNPTVIYFEKILHA